MKTEMKLFIIFIFICAIGDCFSSSIPLPAYQSYSSYLGPASSIIDLGQDKTDDILPEHLEVGIIEGLYYAHLNQYLPSAGAKRALKAVADLYSKAYNLDLKYDENVLISAGATEALYSALKAFTNPGDEWILIEPFWPQFKTLVETTGGVLKYASLKPLDPTYTSNCNKWFFDKNELERLFNKNTRGIILNNPHNPTGKVFSLEELQFIADLSEKHNTLILVDHVFEWSVFKPNKFINIASLPSIFNRTVAFGSASKAFLVSGWRIGWAYGPKHLMDKMKSVHNAIMISSPSIPQYAIASGLEFELKHFNTSQSFFYKNAATTEAKRDFIVNALTKSKMKPVIPQSGDCMIVNLPKTKILTFDFVHNSSHEEWFITNSKLIGSSMHDFYSEKNKMLGKDSMRFCFQKTWQTLVNVEKRLLDFARSYV